MGPLDRISELQTDRRASAACHLRRSGYHEARIYGVGTWSRRLWRVGSGSVRSRWRHGLFVRWRRGVNKRIDVGFDVVGDNQTDGSLGATAKVAMRYSVTPGFRLEGGLGAADEGDGPLLSALEIPTRLGITTLRYASRAPMAVSVCFAPGGYAAALRRHRERLFLWESSDRAREFPTTRASSRKPDSVESSRESIRPQVSIYTFRLEFNSTSASIMWDIPD